jgi:HlyD family secretion protein
LITIDVGSKVNAGDPIIYLDTTDLQNQVKQAQAKVNTAQAGLNKLNNGATEQDINVAQASVKEAQTAVESYQTQLDSGLITSPISGIVSFSNIHEGEVASTGVTLVTIVNNDSLYVDGYIPEDMLDEIKVGKEVIVKVSNIPDKRFKGEISIINPVVNSNNKNVVRVTLKDGSDILKPGMIAEIGLNK